MNTRQEPARTTGLGAGFGALSTVRERRRHEGFEIVFCNPSPEPGDRLGPKALKHQLDERVRRGICTHLAHRLERFEADLILFMPGRTGRAGFDTTELQVRSANPTFQVERICIVDAIDHGTPIWRTPERHGLRPSTRLSHGAQRGVEWNPPRPCRRTRTVKTT